MPVDRALSCPICIAEIEAAVCPWQGNTKLCQMASMQIRILVVDLGAIKQLSIMGQQGLRSLSAKSQP